jgi:hypothetical protein
MSEDFTSDMPPEGGRPPNRSLALGLTVAAAVLLVGAALTRQWLVNGGRGAELGVGLRSVHLCADAGRIARTGFAGETACIDKTNAAFVTMVRELNPYAKEMPSSVFVPMGWVTFVLVLLAAAGLLGAAALTGFKKKNPIPIAPTTVALMSMMLALITAFLFIATKPGAGASMGIGLSFWAFGIGAMLGIAGAQMLVKLNRMD